MNKSQNRKTIYKKENRHCKNKSSFGSDIFFATTMFLQISLLQNGFQPRDLVPFNSRKIVLNLLLEACSFNVIRWFVLNTVFLKKLKQKQDKYRLQKVLKLVGIWYNKW